MHLRLAAAAHRQGSCLAPLMQLQPVAPVACISGSAPVEVAATGICITASFVQAAQTWRGMMVRYRALAVPLPCRSPAGTMCCGRMQRASGAALRTAARTAWPRSATALWTSSAARSCAHTTAGASRCVCVGSGGTAAVQQVLRDAASWLDGMHSRWFSWQMLATGLNSQLTS